MSDPFYITIGRRRNEAVGYLWLVLSGLSVIAMVHAWPKELPILGGPMILAFFIVPILLYRQGHRHFVPSAVNLELQDPRSPILFLRSFKTEGQMVDDEEAIAKVLSRLGPVVAIGDPSNPLPTLGAARDFLPEDAWKQVVLKRLERAQLVLLVAGNTPGLAWEIEQCRKLKDPSKLIIVVPEGETVYRSFIGLTSAHGFSLPSYDTFKDTHTPVVGIITFDDGWQPVPKKLTRIVVFDPINMFDNEVATWRATFEFLLANSPTALRGQTEIGGWSQHWRAIVLVLIVIIGFLVSKHWLS